MVARLDPQKDHKTLIDAFRLVKEKRDDVLLVLVGPGVSPENAELCRLLEKSGVSERVVLLGEQQDVGAIMADFDLHILSSAYGEGFPNVVAESMLMATPNLVTDVGDARFIVGETGWVVPPRDALELSAAIEVVLDASPVEMRARSISARQRILDNFSITSASDAYVKAYERRTVLVLTRYGNLGASSRVRFRQYFSFLEEAGYEIRNRPFFSDSYLQKRYQNTLGNVAGTNATTMPTLAGRTWREP
jgi:glycosyltransferase involved in cell wall biosynthesis